MRSKYPRLSDKAIKELETKGDCTVGNYHYFLESVGSMKILSRMLWPTEFYREWKWDEFLAQRAK